ncbi:MAG TPA: hypothetical protein VNL71_04930, partial [Chloroflexota bacterium]|nr:hypothetical protein [Chloroflexota bacterium]
MSACTGPLFAPYTRLPERVPPRIWTALRGLGLAGALGIVLTAVTVPPVGLTLFWGLFVPIAPVLFLIAPGLWRNVCPMAALNQLPRALGFTRGWTLPSRVQQSTPLISAGLFLLILPLRKITLDHDGAALAAFLLALLGLALVGGLAFKGKSGWCTQFCPMLQVERFYGQSPILVVRNSHCRSCVGCSRNCYDANPTAAYLKDLHDSNSRMALYRKGFAGAMPWVIAAFFSQPTLTSITIPNVLALYGRLLVLVAVGIGAFLIIEARTRFTSYQVVLGHALVAINLFYWFVTPQALQRLGLAGSRLPHLIQAGVLVISLAWAWRALPRERAFLST